MVLAAVNAACWGLVAPRRLSSLALALGLAVVGCGQVSGPVLVARDGHGRDDAGAVVTTDAGPVDAGAVDAGLGPDPLDALVVRIRFDETEGMNARAESERNHVGGRIPDGAVWRPRGGRHAGAVELRGGGVGLGNADRYVTADRPFTVTFWVRPTGTSRVGPSQLFDFPLSPDLAVVWEDGELLARVPRLPTARLAVAWPDDTWHLVWVRFDPEAAALTVGLDDAVLATYERDTTRPTPANLRLGNELRGRLDDFRAYTRVLDDAELRALRAAPP